LFSFPRPPASFFSRTTLFYVRGFVVGTLFLSRPLLGNRLIVDRRSTDLELWLVR
jgi:hypothetical protein